MQKVLTLPSHQSKSLQHSIKLKIPYALHTGFYNFMSVTRNQQHFILGHNAVVKRIVPLYDFDGGMIFFSYIPQALSPVGVVKNKL